MPPFGSPGFSSTGQRALTWYLCIFYDVSWINPDRSPFKMVGMMAILLTIVSSLLSLATFPPLFWVFDGQALSHMSAAALPLVWGHFAVSDCLLMER